MYWYSNRQGIEFSLCLCWQILSRLVKAGNFDPQSDEFSLEDYGNFFPEVQELVQNEVIHMDDSR